VVAGKDIPGSKLNYLQVLREVNRRDIDFSSMESIIKRDVSLSYKLLRFVNSAFFRFSVKIESIRHALVLLGISDIKKWVSLLALAGIGSDKPQELLMLSLVRARFCESICYRIGREKQSDDYFLTGLFSVIDALVDRPMEQVLSGLPLSEQVKQALTGQENTLYQTFSIITAYEHADWNRISHFAGKLGIEESVLPDIFFQSVEWANEAI
jgi:EAL and modified HD-GYP domain-containing signal transduction protein